MRVNSVESKFCAEDHIVIAAIVNELLRAGVEVMASRIELRLGRRTLKY